MPARSSSSPSASRPSAGCANRVSSAPLFAIQACAHPTGLFLSHIPFSPSPIASFFILFVPVNPDPASRSRPTLPQFAARVRRARSLRPVACGPELQRWFASNIAPGGRGQSLHSMNLLAASRSRPRPANPDQAPHSAVLPLRDIAPAHRYAPPPVFGLLPASRSRPRNSNSAGPRPPRADLCGLRAPVWHSHQPRPSNGARGGRGLLTPQLESPSASRRRYQVQPAYDWTRFVRPQRSAPAP